MDASIDSNSLFKVVTPGRFTKISIQTVAGEIEARLSEAGNWELRVRRDEEAGWRMACSGDLDSGSIKAQPVINEPLICGPLTVDPGSRRAIVDGSEVHLTPKEFALVVVLAAQPDRVFTKDELMTEIWGYPSGPNDRTMDHHVSKARRKLRAAGADGMIVNCWGVGYRLWDRADLGPRPALSPLGEAQ